MHAKIPKRRFAGHAVAPSGNFCLEFPLGKGQLGGLARLRTIFNWLWAQWLSLVFPCHSDSLENWERPPCEVHDKPKAGFEA